GEKNPRRQCEVPALRRETGQAAPHAMDVRARGRELERAADDAPGPPAGAAVPAAAAPHQLPAGLLAHSARREHDGGGWRVDLGRIRGVSGHGNLPGGHRQRVGARRGEGLSFPRALVSAMKYRWSLTPPQPALTAFLSKELNISVLLGQCLLNRGLSEPEAISRFLEPRLKYLADPFLLPNMNATVERLFLARHQKERVVIFGDYEVDGVTSSALLSEVLSALGWEVCCYLPHRIEEGYGLSQSGVENCLAK